MDFDIKFEGLDKLIEKIEDFDDVHAMTSAMQDACNIVVGAAIDKAPRKTGALRRSITSKVELTGNSIEGIVYSPLEYAPQTYMRRVNQAKSEKTKFSKSYYYEPDNCRWVTHKVNANNRKRKYVDSEVNSQIAQG